MTDERLRELLQGESVRLALTAPGPQVARAWHAARRAKAMRLHLLFNLIGWIMRIAAVAILLVTTWLAPGALPAVAVPIGLTLWSITGLVRRAPSRIAIER